MHINGFLAVAVLQQILLVDRKNNIPQRRTIDMTQIPQWNTYIHPLPQYCCSSEKPLSSSSGKRLWLLLCRPPQIVSQVLQQCHPQATYS